MSRLNWLMTSFLALVSGLALSPAAGACTLFEEPRSLNTQTFRLAYTGASQTKESAELERSPNQSSESSANDPYEATPLSVEPQQIVFIGNQPNRMFQVIVTDTRRETLAALRICVLDAFATQTQLGRYIQVGSFTHRSEAESISRQLEQAGYPARVIHAGNVDTSTATLERAISFPKEKR